MLLLAFDNGSISDEELIILEENLLTTEFKQSNFPYSEYEPFNRDILDEITCKVEFRFEKHDIPRLQRALSYLGSTCKSL